MVGFYPIRLELVKVELGARGGVLLFTVVMDTSLKLADIWLKGEGMTVAISGIGSRFARRSLARSKEASDVCSWLHYF